VSAREELPTPQDRRQQVGSPPRDSGVAIVGLRDDSRWTGLLLPNLTNWGYQGNIWPVSRSGEPLGGYSAFSSLEELPEVPDAVFLALSAKATIELVAESVKIGVPHVVAIADGFAERNTAEGRALQDQLAEIVAGTTTRLYGPNCVGFADIRSGLCPIASPIARDVEVGSVGMISQSGSLISAVTGAFVEEAVGVDWCASVGNGAAFDVSDAIEYLLDRTTTRIICGYIETFGRASSDHLESLFERASSIGKAIVVIKAGGTSRSAQIALSHTASVAGVDRIVGELMRQHGVIRVKSTEELVRTVTLINHFQSRNTPVRTEAAIAVIEGSGGAAAEAADRLIRGRVALAKFSTETQRILTDTAPSGAFVDNPVDLTGSPKTPDAIRQAYEAIYQDPAVALVLVPWSLTLPGENEGRDFHHETLLRYANLTNATGTPTIVSTTNLHRWTNWMLQFKASHPEVLVVRGLDSTVAALHYIFPQRVESPPAEVYDAEKSMDLRDEAAGRSILAEMDAPLVRGFLSEPPHDDLEGIANSLNPPFVMKVVADGLAHRARIGAVVVGCRTFQDLEEAKRSILGNTKKAGVDKRRIRGLLIEEMVFGPELLVGFNRDSWYGSYLVLARGGVDVEKTESVAILRVPDDDIEGALHRLGIFDTTSADADVISKTVQVIRTLSHEFHGGRLRDYATVELNPLILTQDGPMIADVLLVRMASGSNQVATTKEQETIQ
jgi:acetate---CoA ligase (ADP-forming)